MSHGSTWNDPSGGQDRDAAGAAPGLHVSLSIPDHDARPEVDGVPGRGLDEEPRNALAQPSSLARAVSSETLSVEA